ncbi:ATP-binding cassette domain-containing protein [Leucobacter insecticola]|uniref:ATP-binding cassette domain-containing protein n=1 Tax=Leucobacter insecticola TaxID=2714934 RepID=A0A6G8FJ13_9MICO|nr:ATP-binding cassette domain-containing protein [Leucobacter insecticola]QIM16328.1 ATP-binding cassette domain-containing protein [Leucobacter insecticola]
MTDFIGSGTAGALVVDGIAHGFREAGARRAARRTELTPVLSEVSFEVAPGTLTALLGPSGCGKSTLLRILAGLVVPERGSARSGSRDLIAHPGGIAYHPQRDALLPWLRALDNITLGAETAGRDRAEARAEAVALLEKFGLPGQERAWPDELSGGMRQRVALMRTFLMPQRALVLDEPLGALDALTRRRLQHWLLDITANDGRPILLVTHDIEEALLLADRVLVMSDRPGRIVHVEDRPDAATRVREREEGTDHAPLRRILAALDGEAAAAATRQ